MKIKENDLSESLDVESNNDGSKKSSKYFSKKVKYGQSNFRKSVKSTNRKVQKVLKTILDIDNESKDDDSLIVPVVEIGTIEREPLETITFNETVINEFEHKNGSNTGTNDDRIVFPDDVKEGHFPSDTVVVNKTLINKTVYKSESSDGNDRIIFPDDEILKQEHTPPISVNETVIYKTTVKNGSIEDDRIVFPDDDILKKGRASSETVIVNKTIIYKTTHTNGSPIKDDRIVFPDEIDYNEPKYEETSDYGEAPAVKHSGSHWKTKYYKKYPHKQYSYNYTFGHVQLPSHGSSSSFSQVDDPTMFEEEETVKVYNGPNHRNIYNASREVHRPVMNYTYYGSVPTNGSLNSFSQVNYSGMIEENVTPNHAIIYNVTKEFSLPTTNYWIYNVSYNNSEWSGKNKSYYFTTEAEKCEIYKKATIRRELVDKATCKTHDCKKISSKILSYMNHSADPCKNFYQYACGGFESNPQLTERNLESLAFDRIKSEPFLLSLCLLNKKMLPHYYFIGEMLKNNTENNFSKYYQSCLIYNEVTKSKDRKIQGLF